MFDEMQLLEDGRDLQRLLSHYGDLGKADRRPDVLDGPGMRLAVEVLGELATPEARALLRELAAGPAESVVAREARRVLRRARKD